MSERKDAYEVGFRDGLQEALSEVKRIHATAANVGTLLHVKDVLHSLIAKNQEIDQLIKNTAED